MKNVKVTRVQDLTMDKFNSSSITKLTLAKWLESARDIMCRQADVIVKMQNTIELLKTDSLEDKAAIIKLQSDLIQTKDHQLLSLQSAVKSTVETVVQKEVKSYSEAVAKNSTVPGVPAMTPDSVKRAVQSAISDEDRGKNLIVFGLDEVENENLDSRVGELLQELGEKPRLTASRVGKIVDGAEKCRPVKVVLTSSNIVKQILSKSGMLKRAQRFGKVYLRPDMTPEEREQRKRLFIELKQNITDQPQKYH